MRKMVTVLIAILVLETLSAQKVLTVATDQTINLVFPSPVVHVDRGTRDVLVQIVKESERIILVKAANRNFRPTSMSVLTADGNLYSFVVKYDSVLTALVYTLQPEKKGSMIDYARSVLNQPSFLHGVRDHSWKIYSRVTGIYIKDSLLFFQLLIENRSVIAYDIAELRFYIRDKRKGKRTSIQEEEITPLYIQGNTNSIAGGEKQNIVIVFPKFTIPDAKVFTTEITERDGGRSIRMSLNNSKLMKTVTLNDLIN